MKYASLWGLLFISFCPMHSANAVICMPIAIADSNNGADYFSMIVSTLEEAQAGFNSEEEGKISLLKTGANGLSTLIASYKTANLHYECAATRVVGYKTSSDEMISSSANSIEQALNAISAENLNFIESMKAAVDGNSGKTPGDLAEAQADQRLKIKGAWEKLVVSTMGATFAVLPPNKDGKKNDRISLTSKQRSALIDRLKKIRERGPKHKDVAMPEAAATQLRKFLMEKWHSSDEK
jgi:hypothetical protein